MIYEGTEYEIDEALSFRDFTGWDFHSLPEYDFSGKIIYGSCFSNECPEKRIFPDDMIGATFIKCNLDNIYIPDGNTVIDCLTRRFALCTDGNDWLLDGTYAPEVPVNAAHVGDYDPSTVEVEAI